jgi:aspartate racemase
MNSTMHLGLIVGIGPAATDYYYRYLIAALARSGKDLELTMAHADTATLLRHQASGDARAQVEIYARLAARLKAAGAQTLAITSIAGHFCIREFEAVSPLPIINLLAEVNREITSRKLRKLGLIGTRGVMESRFYGAVGDAEIIPPPGDSLMEVHDAYVAMAAAGKITEVQRQIFFTAARRLIDDFAVEAVMLAGTDLALAFNDRDHGFPIIDCAEVHAAAIVKVAMQ